LVDREKDTYAVHCCKGGWRDKSFYQRIKEKLAKNNFLRKITGKRTYIDLT
jgi:hypothetical protein